MATEPKLGTSAYVAYQHEIQLGKPINLNFYKQRQATEK
jgi:hypothetical protein